MTSKKPDVSRYMSIEVKVAGGFPAIYHFTMCGADRSVGIMDDYIEDEVITTKSGHSCGWLKISDKDLERVRSEAYKYIDGIRHSHDDY